MTRWMQIAQRSEIEPGESKVVKLGDERVAVFNADGEFYAIDNTCPHQGDHLEKAFWTERVSLVPGTNGSTI